MVFAANALSSLIGRYSETRSTPGQMSTDAFVGASLLLS